MVEQSTTKNARSRNERRLGGTRSLGRIGVPLVAALIVAGTIVLGVAGIGAGATVPADDSDAAQQGSEMVEFTATEFTVSAPADTTYHVVLTLQDSSSGQEYRVVGGPFVGPLHERIDDPDTAISKVEVLVD